MLAKKAAEQGRVLYVNELTDDATYQLIEQSAVIRSLVTREMVARGYLTLRPTEQENLEKQRREKLAEAEARRATLAVEREDQILRQAATAQIESGRMAASSQGPPQIPMEADVDTSARIRPDQLPGLLSTGMSMPQQGMGGANPGMGAAAGLGAGGVGSMGGFSGMGNPGMTSVPEGEGLPTSNQQQSASIPRRSGMPIPQPGRSEQDSSLLRRSNPYANVPSLYDLYAQARPQSGPLQRFGVDIFRNPSGTLNELPMDLPVGPEYVLGPGDGIKVELWGSVSQRLQRVVDRGGRVALPEVGTIQVAGRSLGDVQREVQTVLRTQFRDVEADLSLNRIRSVRVYVVGDVTSPGAYDISSLSTPLNAVYAAGGPTDNGSMRTVRHLRNRNLVQEVDLYDLLLNGTRSDLQTFQPGDTILVPPIGAQVAVEGMVRRPALYEVRSESTLAEVLALAGGVLPAGTLRSIDLERLQAHEGRTRLRLDLPEAEGQQAVEQRLAEFRVQDGDRVRISPILPYSQKTVFLDGHVFRPGKYAFQEGMKVTDLVKGFDDLLPEPSHRHAEIIRLQPPDFRPVVMAFNLGDALAGRAEAPALQPLDTVRVFSRYDFEDPPVVVVGGEVRSPGEHRTNGEVHVRDAIYLAGGLTPDAQLGDAQVFRRNPGGEMQIFSLNLANALAGDSKDNILLRPRDRVIVHRNMAKLDPPTVSIQGEVANPGKYPLGETMTIAELVQSAGGFKRSAYTETADLSRYLVQNDTRVLGEHQEVAVAKALSGDPASNIALRDGDVLTIRQIGGWDDIGAGVTVAGEMLHPGTYGIQEGERLSSVL
ncbi:MAG: SLBB domain-containing protein, partial [Thermomicrobiales bacterium]